MQDPSARTGNSDATVAQATLAQGRNDHDMLCTRQSETTVRATRTGTLISREVEPADVVRLSRTLMWLSPARET